MLKLKYIWEGLSVFETKALFDHPGTINDRLFVATIKSQLIGIPKKVLDRRLVFLSSFLNIPRLDYLLFKQWKEVCVYEILEIDKPIRKPKKYSGYVKSPSAVGRKRATSTKSDPGIFEWSAIEEIDYFHALTVGDFIGESLVIHLPDDGPIEPKRLLPKLKKK